MPPWIRQRVSVLLKTIWDRRRSDAAVRIERNRGPDLAAGAIGRIAELRSWLLFVVEPLISST